jgi:hypothetical protein
VVEKADEVATFSIECVSSTSYGDFVNSKLVVAGTVGNAGDSYAIAHLSQTCVVTIKMNR